MKLLIKIEIKSQVVPKGGQGSGKFSKIYLASFLFIRHSTAHIFKLTKSFNEASFFLHQQFLKSTLPTPTPITNTNQNLWHIASKLLLVFTVSHYFLGKKIVFCLMCTYSSTSNARMIGLIIYKRIAVPIIIPINMLFIASLDQ